jgi:hypothetical protein
MVTPLIRGLFALQLGLLSSFLFTGRDAGVGRAAEDARDAQLGDALRPAATAHRGPPPAWQHIGTLTPGLLTADGHFGRQVAAIGEHVLIGAEPGSGCPTCSPAELFRLRAGVFESQGVLPLPAAANHATCGAHLAAGDGFFALSDSGQADLVHVFDPNGVPVAALPSPNPGAVVTALAAAGAEVFAGVATTYGTREVVYYAPAGAPLTWAPPVTLPQPVSVGGSAGYGDALAASGDWLFVGAPLDDGIGTNAGAVYVFERVAGGWVFRQKLTAPETVAFDRFGNAVAVQGQTAVVGAWNRSDVNFNNGAAYVFTESGGTWSYAEKLANPTHPARAEYQWFGYSVALGGEWMIVGAANQLHWCFVDGARQRDYAYGAGAVFVYRWDGSTWEHRGAWAGVPCTPGAQFGYAVAFSNIGYAVLTAPGTGAGSTGSSGAFVYGFEDCDGNGYPDLLQPDCNDNYFADRCEIAAGAALDCNGNEVPDECDIGTGDDRDCNANGVPDSCDLAAGSAVDCNGNGVPDACELAGGTAADCNANGVLDVCDLASGASDDCNDNGVPDECDLSGGSATDCNGNSVPDSCDIASGVDPDCDGNGTPDSCDIASGLAEDCNQTGVPDGCELASGATSDCNGNGVPDVCDLGISIDIDCNENGVWDACELVGGTAVDCNTNNVPDDCDIASGAASDCNANAIPDICDLGAGTSRDCDGNGRLDVCDLHVDPNVDCNHNGLHDACELLDGTAADCDGSGQLDDCEIGRWTATSVPAGAPVPDGRVSSAISRDGVWLAQSQEKHVAIYQHLGGGWQHHITLDGHVTGRTRDVRAIAIGDGVVGVVLSLLYQPGLPNYAIALYERASDGWHVRVYAEHLQSGDQPFGRVAIGDGFVAFCLSSPYIGVGGNYVLDVYRRNGVGWTLDPEPQRPPAHSAPAGFGALLLAQGDRLVIGTAGTPDPRWPTVYRFDGNEWEIEQVLDPGFPIGGWGGWSGYVDDDVLVVSGDRVEIDGKPVAFVHIFEYDGIAWQHVQDVWVPGWSSAEIAGTSVSFCAVTRVAGYPVFDAQMACFERDAAGWQFINRPELPRDATGQVPSFAGIVGSVLFLVATDYSNPDRDHYALRFGYDCDDDGGLDACQIDASNDCNQNFRLDRCEVLEPGRDCNANALVDDCEILGIGNYDGNGIFGTGDLDGLAVTMLGPGTTIDGACRDLLRQIFDIDLDTDIDLWDVARLMNGTVDADCNGNGVRDVQELADGTAMDCNHNFSLDECDLLAGVSEDCDENGVPDACDLQQGVEVDCDLNGVLDECQIPGIPGTDCDENGVPDICEVAVWPGADCDADGVLDRCELPTFEPVTIGPDLPETALLFGESIDAEGDTILIGVRFGWGGPLRSGSAELYALDDGAWVKQAQFRANDGTRDSYFGWSVALNGDTIAIGAIKADATEVDCGAVYVFERSGDTWQQSAKLLGSDTATDDHFGNCVALHGDTLVIGAPYNTPENYGAAYVFEQDGGVWTQVARFTSPLPGGQHFAYSAAIDGDTMIIGQPPVSPNRGAAFIYTRQNGVWALDQELEPDLSTPHGEFGYAVDILGDTAVVGCYGSDAAFVYEREAGKWIRVARLAMPAGQFWSAFGLDVAVSDDAIAIGASNAYYQGVSDEGAAFVFRKDYGHWSLYARLLPEDPDGDTGSFGSSVDFSAGRVVVADRSYGYPYSAVGAVWVYDDFLEDCNLNEIVDTCEMAAGLAQDCNGNSVIDACDIPAGLSTDCNENELLDACESFTLGDWDGDGYFGSVELDEIRYRVRPDQPVSGLCATIYYQVFDADADFDIDLADIAKIMTLAR